MTTVHSQGSQVYNSPFYWHRARRGKFRARCKGCMSRYHAAKSGGFGKRSFEGKFDLPEGHKRCPKCLTVKPRTEEFWHKRSRGDGFRETCKQCHCTEVSSKRAKRPRAKRFTRQQVIQRYMAKPEVAVSKRISNGIRKAIGSKKAGRRWETLVGYSLDELMSHLEKLFKPGMTWQNMGDWHIDHVRPVTSFSFSSEQDEGFSECWAISNLQPLWAIDNLKKNAKYP